MDKKHQTISHLLARWRGWIQAGAALLTNLHLPNFFKGSLYQGAGKTVCVPGLNCYSCPAASGEFPIVKDTTPNMMNPRLYTTSYNKPQGQQFDDTAVLSFIKLQYT